MRLFRTTILCLLISQCLSAQRPTWLAAAFAKDSIRVQRLEEKHKRLPQSLSKEIRILDSMLQEICDKSNFVHIEHCKSIHDKLKKFRGKLNQIEKDVGVANRKLSSIKTTLANSPRTSRESYNAYRKYYLDPKIREYDQIFEQIRRGEKQLVRRAIWYAARNYWNKDPFPTTVVGLYLAQTRKEEASQKTVEIVSLKKDKDALERIKKGLDDQIAGSKSQSKVLSDSTRRLQMALDSINSQKIKLDSISVKRSNDFNKKTEDFKRKWKLSYDSLEQIGQLLSCIKDSLDSQTLINNDLERANKELGNSLRIRMDSLKIVSDSLNLAHIDLQNAQTKLEEAVSQRVAKLLWVGLTLFLLLALLGQYQRFRNARIGKQKVRSANANLATANAELKTKQGELKTLIGELHHRTKNNLQEISSLLYLQAREKDDETLKVALNEARGRIDAIGIVHRLLYQDKYQKPTAVNIAEYIEELVGHLFKSHHLSRENVCTTFNLQQVYIETDKAIQVGLITNELVHNSLKHAFLSTKHPEISISLEAEAGALYLTVSDNGPGLPLGAKWTEINSFGLKLVRQLVEGRHGMLRYDHKNGATFKVTLPLDTHEYEIAT